MSLAFAACCVGWNCLFTDCSHSITATVYSWVVLRILKKHKDEVHGAKRDDRDASYALPDASGRSNSPHLCFHDRDDHQSAELLNQLGIYLGDDDDEKKGVNDLSQNELEKDYFDVTEGGRHCRGAEPYVFDEDPGRITQPVECVVCKTKFTLVNVEFSWTNEDDPDVDNQSGMSKNVSLSRRDPFWASANFDLGMDLALHFASRG